MKKILVLLIAGLSSAAIAGDFQKDPEVMAKECAKRAAGFLEEVKALEERAAKATGTEAQKIKKFADLTREEAEALVKAGKAWANNQVRLAEKHLEKANEICGKRGKLAPEIYPPCEDKKEAAKDDKACEPEKPAGPAKEEKPKSELDKLHEQLEGLGKAE